MMTGQPYPPVEEKPAEAKAEEKKADEGENAEADILSAYE
jgi:hypothetical protein